MQSRAREKSLIKSVMNFLESWLLFTFSDKLKFGIKVSLSLMLAYMIPMGMGWSQPNTAAMTVMLIATAGVVGESVMKGTIRVVGTVIGAIIGMTLLALFPQERMTYLLIVSILVPLILYLYNVYQGDGTVFMLTAMMILMVFKGGEVDDAFLYGVDRTYMTVFGIVIYTLIGLFLWPVKQEDSTIEDALELSALQLQFFNKIVDTADESSDEALLSKIGASEQKLQSAYVEASGASLAMALNASTWESISKLYGGLNTLLTMLSVHTKEGENLVYAGYINDYHAYVSEITSLLSLCETAWRDEKVIPIPVKKTVRFEKEKLKTLSNLQQSAVVTHAELMSKIHHLLRVLADRLNMLNGVEQTIAYQERTQAAPRFVWLDPEYLRGIIQTFLIFWFSTALWIYFNPPGGFIVVTLATLLSLLTSFSPLKPSTLATLFSLGFVFALLMYIFVLPNLVYGWQLALFIFVYSFIAFYVINPKLSIFFLLGMFTIGIGNTMHYNFDIFLITLLMFYLFLAILMLFYYLPFSTKAEHLFLTMKRRLFWHATTLLTHEKSRAEMNWFERKVRTFHILHLDRTANKLTLWASQVDTSYFNTTTKEQLMAFSTECRRFSTKLRLLAQYEEKLEDNVLYAKLEALREQSLLAEVAHAMMELAPTQEVESIFQKSSANFVKLEEKVERVKESINPEEYTQEEVTEFYINIALHHSVWIALSTCHVTMKNIDFEQLQESRF